MIRIRSSALVTLALMAGAGRAQSVLERTVLAMGTRLSLQVEGPTEEGLRAASETALAEVARVEGALSTWRPESVLSHLNASRGAVVTLDAEWLDLLVAVRAQAARTGGAFDPALMPLVAAWGLRDGGRVPTAAELRRARAASGFWILKLDRRAGTAQLQSPAAGLEEGAFGKGYALDRAKARMVGAGVESGLLDLGGQLLAFGTAGFVSLADPKDRARPRLSFRLKDASLSTSGTSERGRHILDPRTGRPCRAWGSASAVAGSGLEADCLSTALYVMGPDKGLRWATVHKVAACFLLSDGQIRMSPAFRALAPHVH